VKGLLARFRTSRAEPPAETARDASTDDDAWELQVAGGREPQLN
jgi:hypothetical protein